MRCAIIHSAEAFSSLAGAWDDLGRRAEPGLFLSHAWLSSWWRAFHGVDELWVLTLEADDGQLVAGWPLHLRAPRSGALRVGELRAIGDLSGAAGTGLDRSIVCQPGRERQACAAFIDTLLSTRGWDVLDVPTSRRELADALELALINAGSKLER
ncbi:MAG TPA: hypothetical protein VIA18_08330, partial [Polyangia bacterium]|nr:hypothetical protein [Polyangia bacterium]